MEKMGDGLHRIWKLEKIGGSEKKRKYNGKNTGRGKEKKKRLEIGKNAIFDP